MVHLVEHVNEVQRWKARIDEVTNLARVNNIKKKKKKKRKGFPTRNIIEGVVETWGAKDRHH
jgi:hypothetical protein